MVGVLSLKSTAADLEARFDVSIPASFSPVGEIAPGGHLVVLDAGSPGRAIMGRWGTGYDRSQPERTTVRADDLGDRQSLEDAFDRGRVVVLADGVRVGDRWLERIDEDPFAIAGVQPAGTAADGVLLITTDGVDLASEPVPVVLGTDQVDIWLHYSHAPELSALLVPPQSTSFRVESNQDSTPS